MSDPRADPGSVLDEIAASVAPLLGEGRIADYIPTLEQQTTRTAVSIF